LMDIGLNPGVGPSWEYEKEIEEVPR